jgi:hypothetical protein
VLRGVVANLTLKVHILLSALILHLSLLNLSDITPLLPTLISLLSPDGDTFAGASSALQELMTRSAMSDGSGSKSLTEPLLLWLDRIAPPIIEATLRAGSADEISHSLVKLLAALGDHSASYFAAHIVSEVPVNTTTGSPTKGHLTQSFLKFILSYTALPGYYGIDEDESEMTLGFWYMFQEALWNVDYFIEDGYQGEDPRPPHENQLEVARAVYRELVQVLRRKITLPMGGAGWSRGAHLNIVHFAPLANHLIRPIRQVPCVSAIAGGQEYILQSNRYRRDVGDTLLNA